MILSFPNESGAGPDEKVPQNLKDLFDKSIGSAGFSFLRSLTTLIHLTQTGKKLITKTILFSRKAYRPNKDRWRVKNKCH